MIAIHAVHRRLAEIVYMSTDRTGNTIIGPAELKLLIPLLRQNLELVRRMDELQNLAFQAHLAKDDGWLQDICRQIDALEAMCL
ncbi:DUF7667 family protein [Cohnella algarum]|uniref:DUF7667 family protein n=1 Tax=Cohnella algarum TaxID=2044859 RepID=UPI0019687A9D|nr:hypothetical protein [Cohnella algarum]MBN2980153.1 hypothetical protein [Cohnella algarum]